MIGSMGFGIRWGCVLSLNRHIGDLGDSISLGFHLSMCIFSGDSTMNPGKSQTLSMLLTLTSYSHQQFLQLYLCFIVYLLCSPTLVTDHLSSPGLL